MLVRVFMHMVRALSTSLLLHHSTASGRWDWSHHATDCVTFSFPSFLHTDTTTHWSFDRSIDWMNIRQSTWTCACASENRVMFTFSTDSLLPVVVRNCFFSKFNFKFDAFYILARWLTTCCGFAYTLSRIAVVYFTGCLRCPCFISCLIPLSHSPLRHTP